MELSAVISALCSVCGAVFAGLILRRLDKKEKLDDARAAQQHRESLLILKNVKAVSGLSEKTAVCVKNGRVNGDMDAAMNYAIQQRHELQNFLDEQAIHQTH